MRRKSSHEGEMDLFRVTVHLAGAAGERSTSMEALVDTGASYSWIPRDVLEGLGGGPRGGAGGGTVVRMGGRPGSALSDGLGPGPARRTQPADARRVR